MILRLIYSIVYAVINVCELLLIARALMSWFPLDYSNPIVAFLHTVTEPVLKPVRNMLHKIPALANLPIDFSIIVVFLILEFTRIIL